MRKQSRWFVGQIGRREGYVVPSALHSIGALVTLHTDAWATNYPEKLLGLGIRSVRKRWREDLAGADVTSCFTRFSLAKIACLGASTPSRFWAVGGSLFSRSAAASFRRAGMGSGDVCLGYTAGNLETIQTAKRCGARALHVQIDPGLEWYRLRDKLRALHPSAEDASPPLDASFVRRIEEEWHSADFIICHSAHTKESLGKVGVVGDKMRIIPPGFLPELANQPRSYPAGRRPRALFLGNVCLMKGFHDYCELARRLGGVMEFHCAGTMHMSRDFLQKRGAGMIIHGHLQPKSVRALLESVDILVFPSHSEGFGLVQLEAMSAGLPVLSTTACGDVVVDGKNGRRFHPGDVDSAEKYLREVFSSHDSYEKLSAGALLTASGCTLEKQIASLLALVG